MIDTLIKPINPCRYNGFTRCLFILVKPKEKTDHELVLERVDRIIKYVFLKLGQDYRHYGLRSRKEDLVKAKRIAIYLILMHVKIFTTELGQIFGMHYSTIIFHRDSCRDTMSIDPILKRMVLQIENDLKL